MVNCIFYDRLLPNDTQNAIELFKSERIPYSQYYNIDEISDKSTNLPHMMPDESTFIHYMKKMDIRKSDEIICYDRKGIFSSPRVWFTFKIFGANNVKVLNGGYPKWIKENLPIEKQNNFRLTEQNSLRSPPQADDYDFKLDRTKIVDMVNIVDISLKKLKSETNEQIVDCRPSERYKGEAPEPRPGLRKGHIDGAINVPFKDILNENFCYKGENEIKKLVESRGINLKSPLNLYCGSGITACVVILGLGILGKLDSCKLYDGSWAEIVI
jgi:thiosulfate/3-mercaptopyruvate sulfurtransferase